MNYKQIILLVLAVIGDFLLGVLYPGVIPVFLVLAVFYLSQKTQLLQTLSFAILAGLLVDMSQLSGTIFTTVFLSAIAIGTSFLSKKYFDLSNRFTQIGSLVIIFALKVLSSWLLYDRAWPSQFLNTSIIISLLTVIVVSLILLSQNVKKV